MLKRHYINLCILAPNYAHPLAPLKFVSKKKPAVAMDGATTTFSKIKA